MRGSACGQRIPQTEQRSSCRASSGDRAAKPFKMWNMTELRDFFELTPNADRTRWHMPLHTKLCSGIGAVFGGIALGAGITALEALTERKVRWSTAQYLSFARPPGVMEYDLEVLVQGHQVTQARAVGSVDGQRIVEINAALGTRHQPVEGTWVSPPAVPRPDECPPRQRLAVYENTLFDHIELRLAAGRPIEDLKGAPGDGTSALWFRMPGYSVDAATLAIAGDYVPSGVSEAVGELLFSNSIDNTIRVMSPVQSEWILIDIGIEGIKDGFGHGFARLWSLEGELMGIASQTLIVRSLDATLARFSDTPAARHLASLSDSDAGTRSPDQR